MQKKTTLFATMLCACIIMALGENNRAMYGAINGQTPQLTIKKASDLPPIQRTNNRAQAPQAKAYASALPMGAVITQVPQQSQIKKAAASRATANDIVLAWTNGNEPHATINGNEGAVLETSVSVGSDLNVTGPTSYSAIPEFTVPLMTYQPRTYYPGYATEDMIEYTVKLKDGMIFIPSSVEFDLVKEGSDISSISWSYTINGSESPIKDYVNPQSQIRRNNNANPEAPYTHVEKINAAGAQVFTLRFYISNVADNKKMSIGNIKINGTVQNEAEEWIDLGTTTFLETILSGQYTTANVQKSATRPGWYRIQGMWNGTGVEGTPPLEIDASNPDCVKVYPQGTSLEFSEIPGEIIVLSLSVYYEITSDMTDDAFIREQPNENITLKDNVLTFNTHSMVYQLNGSSDVYWGNDQPMTIQIPWQDDIYGMFHEDFLAALFSESAKDQEITVDYDTPEAGYVSVNNPFSLYVNSSEGSTNMPLIVDISDPGFVHIPLQNTGIVIPQFGRIYIVSIDNFYDTKDEFMQSENAAGLITMDKNNRITIPCFLNSQLRVSSILMYLPDYDEGNAYYIEASGDSWIQLPNRVTTVATPTFTLNGVDMVIECATANVKIYYTLDGSTPTAKSNLYTGPIHLTRNCWVNAIAIDDNGNESKVATYMVNSFKVAKPQWTFDGTRLTITCDTPDAAIYYTLGNGNPTAQSTRYTSPIEIVDNRAVRAVAVRDGYHDSDIMEFSPESKSCEPVTITITGTTCTMHTNTTGATIRYTLDGSTPSTMSPIYTGPITISGNCKIRAIASKEYYEDSQVSEYVVNTFVTATPVISLNGDQISITCATAGAKIYYSVNNTIVNETSTPYTGAFKLPEHSIIRAIAYVSGYNPSAVAIYNTDQTKCAAPSINYDGRQVSLSAESGASIYYTTDGSDPSLSSMLYTEPFDGKDMPQIKAVAHRNGITSEISDKTIGAYYDGDNVIASPGMLSEAFGWVDDLSTIRDLSINGSITDADFATLRRLTGLESLDLSVAQIQSVPDMAFSGLPVRVVTFPDNITSVGSSIFTGCDRLCAVVWNSFARMSDKMLDGVANPNMLVYVHTVSLAPSTYTGNVVANKVAQSIRLVDAPNADFYCPIEFTTREISYTRTFTLPTIIGKTAGWESISLPFDVQTITHATKGELAPFEANRFGVKNFWLSQIENGRLTPTDRIEAYKPYTISMPNNSAYVEDYIVSGDVTFSAKNATIRVTECETVDLGMFVMMPTMNAIARDQRIFAINLTDEGHNPAGSMFVPDTRDVKPFEAFVMPTNSSWSRALKISDLMGGATSGIDTLPLRDQDTKIYLKSGVLYIVSPTESEIDIYTINATLVRHIKLCEGINSIEGLQKGVYLVGGHMVAVY